MGLPEQPPPAPEPLGLSESLEASLRALLQPGDVFARLRLAPCPGYGQMLFQLLFWSAMGGLLTVILILMNQPSAAMGPLPIAVGLAGTLALLVPASFAAAGLLHVLALLSGGQDGFGRSYQILSLLASLAPVAAVSAWVPFPMAWLLPTVYGTILCVRAVELLHQAPAVQSWLVVGVFGGLVAFGEVLAEQKAASLLHGVENMANIYSNPSSGTQPSTAILPQAIEGEAQMASGAAASAVAPSSALTQPLAEGAAGGAGLPSMNMDNALSQVRSSLEMINSGAGRTGAPAVGGGQPLGGQQQQLEQLSKMTMNMLNMANKQLAANPHAYDNLPPDQRAQLTKLMQMANQMIPQAQVATSPKASREQQQRALQQMMQQVMGNPPQNRQGSFAIGPSGRVDPSALQQRQAPARRRADVPNPDAVVGAE